MKKIISIIILGVLLFGSLGSVADVADVKKPDFGIVTIKETMSFSIPIIEEENDGVTIHLKEANSYLLDPGSPLLPVVNKMFMLPFGSTVNSVEVRYDGKNEMLLSKKVKLAAEPMPIGAFAQVKNEQQVDATPLIVPEEQFDYRLGSGLSNNERVLFLTVQCYPILLNTVENCIYYYDTIEICVSYSEGVPFYPLGSQYDLVIISSKDVTPTIQKFIDHKNEHNVRALFKHADDIYNEFSGRDEAEKIKYFIKDAIETYGILYVLLLGDIYSLPTRYSRLRFWRDPIDLPTDLYYADIYDAYGNFCCWDANNNNVFGEFDRDLGNIDEVDLYADVMVGRIPFQNIVDLNIVLNKIITYEKSAYDSNWFKKILLMGGDTFPNHGNIEGEFVTNLIGQEMEAHGFEPIKLWTSENTFKPLNINMKVTAGAGFISYSGHGYIHGFGTSPPNVERRIDYYNPYLIGMFNRNKLPIVFFDACSTATLDYTAFNILRFPGFAYNIVKKPAGGAIAAIGATEVAYTNVDHSGVKGGAGYLNLHFFKNYEEGTTVGEMLTKSQNAYINNVGHDFLTIEQFIIIGDPSLKIGGFS
jgi:hypothetical protein